MLDSAASYENQIERSGMVRNDGKERAGTLHVTLSLPICLSSRTTRI